MSSDKDQLLAMGFDPARVDWALKATRNSGLQPAMDHVLENSEKPVPTAEEQNAGAGAPDDDDDAEALAAHIKKTGASDELIAKSIKCSECGKVFRSQATASFHAEKSGHQEFEESTEEIKPLTEEEKKAKLAELREKLAAKRAVQSKEDEKSARANEASRPIPDRSALRRKAGQDSGKIKEDLQLKEINKEAERKRREKIEDQKARAAIKAQIEADKRERAEKAAREKAAREGATLPPTTSSANSAPSKPVAAVKSSENPETRLQIRLSAGGPPLTKTFASDSTLVDVAEWVASESLAYNVDTVTFASTFPRKTYSSEDMKKSLKENGLTPSAVLMAS